MGIKRPSGENRRRVGEVLLRGPQVVEPRAGEAVLRTPRVLEARGGQSGSTEGLDEDGWLHTGNDWFTYSGLGLRARRSFPVATVLLCRNFTLHGFRFRFQS